MIRYYVLKDGAVVSTTCSKDEALYMIRQAQAKETHYMLRANFSIITGEEEFISYPKVKKSIKLTKTSITNALVND